MFLLELGAWDRSHESPVGNILGNLVEDWREERTEISSHQKLQMGKIQLHVGTSIIFLRVLAGTIWVMIYGRCENTLSQQELRDVS